MSLSPVELVKSYYDSQAPGKRQCLMELLDPNIVLELPEGFPGSRARYAGLRTYLEDFLELVYGALDGEFFPDKYLEAGTRVVVTGVMKGRAISSGIPFVVPFAALWTVKGRTLLHARFFTDTAILSDAIASRPTRTPSA